MVSVFAYFAVAIVLLMVALVLSVMLHNTKCMEREEFIEKKYRSARAFSPSNPNRHRYSNQMQFDVSY